MTRTARVKAAGALAVVAAVLAPAGQARIPEMRWDAGRQVDARAVVVRDAFERAVARQGKTGLVATAAKLDASAGCFERAVLRRMRG